MATTLAAADCPRCRRGREVFWYLGLYEYDVDRARALVRDGREAVELEEESVRSSVAESELDEGHVPHVDPALPGVIAHVRYRTDGGELLKGHVLIDGHHRAARCLREGRPFSAYLLDEGESEAVLLRRPDDPFPRAKVRPRPDGDGFALDGPRGAAPWRLDERQHFVYVRLDGRHTADAILSAYAAHFGEPLSREALNRFVLKAQDRGCLEGALDRADAAEDSGPAVRAYEERFPRSRGLFERARRVIAGATTHDRRGFGPFPVYVDRAEGVRKWDAEGRPLLDYWMGHGALLCGHGFPPVVEAITKQALRGTHYGACHEAEVRWAERVCALVPSAERVRFTASGTEATLLALRVARAYTGRPRVLKFDRHFHGWHDEAMAHFFPAPSAGFSPGALASVGVVRPAAPDALAAELAKGDVAAVLLEPGGGSAGGLPWGYDFLRELRRLTRQHGALLIFDEVITGFRVSPGGVQQVTGVLPDLTTLAKILCGGLPGGAVAGSAEVMAVFGPGTSRGERRAQVPHTGTFNGNPLSAAAGLALLDHVADGAAQERARRAAERLAVLVNDAAEAEGVDVHLYTNGTSIYHVLIGARAAGAALGPSDAVATLHHAHPERYARLRRALLLEGLDTHPVHGWVSALHDDEEVLQQSARAFAAAFRALRGEPGFAR